VDIIVYTIIGFLAFINICMVSCKRDMPPTKSRL
jgi:hypothetical protein